MSDFEPADPPIVRELKRIFGDRPQETDGPKAFTILPLVGEVDALEFFRTVPAGVSMAKLTELARVYRAEHPNPIVDAADEDLESAG
jgi:hypothetical protein